MGNYNNTKKPLYPIPVELSWEEKKTLPVGELNRSTHRITLEKHVSPIKQSNNFPFRMQYKNRMNYETELL